MAAEPQHRLADGASGHAPVAAGVSAARDTYPGIAVFQAHDVEASEVEGVSELLEGQASLSKDQEGDDFFVAIARAAKGKHSMGRVWTGSTRR
jgi:hypothetical protein